MGFPDTYGATMDAWVDCLSYLRDDDGMSKFRLKPNEVLEIVIKDAGALDLEELEALDAEALERIGR